LALRGTFHTNGARVPVSPGWFALSHRYRDATIGALSRNRWYKIKSCDGSIYRVLRFSPRLRLCTAEREGTIALDWDGCLELWGGHTGGGPRELLITEASVLEKAACAWNYPDPAVRLALQWALVVGATSIVIGVVGIILNLK